VAPAKNDRSLSIEFLRAGCVLYIVGFWHLMDYTHGFVGYDNAVTVRLTVTVLGLFTFLSGFLIAQAPMQLRAAELKCFYTRRLLRIYPLYLLALLAFWALGLADRGTALKAALGISMVYGPPPATLWFITMILVFYLIAPLLIALRERPARFAAACLGIFALAGVLGHAASGDIRIAEYFPAFALGVRWTSQGRRRSTHAAWWATGAAAAACALSLAFPADPQFSLTASPMATFGALAVFLLADRLPLPSNGGLVRAVEKLSYASFAMYLFHRVVYKGLHALFDPVSSALGLAWLLLVCLPVVIAVAAIVQKAYDAARKLAAVRSGPPATPQPERST
jgi:peptidoglycan/LPS O-acetylase OafA/YrhL